jgi:hypothetical protein
LLKISLFVFLVWSSSVLSSTEIFQIEINLSRPTYLNPKMSQISWLRFHFFVANHLSKFKIVCRTKINRACKPFFVSEPKINFVDIQMHTWPSHEAAFQNLKIYFYYVKLSLYFCNYQCIDDTKTTPESSS